MTYLDYLCRCLLREGIVALNNQEQLQQLIEDKTPGVWDNLVLKCMNRII